jgi:hypothetical protein
MVRRFLLLALPCSALLAGYVPSIDRSHEALELVLEAWQAGEPAGPVNAGDFTIRVVDSTRRPGQKLKKFTIFGETPGDGPRCFAVQLQMEEPREELRARFVLVGIDPLWVFRYEDYERMTHLGCGDESPPPALLKTREKVDPGPK